jgi:DnaK suppressor protein
MNKEDLEYFKEILENQLEELAAKAEGTVIDSIYLDMHTSDPLDRASIDMNLNTTMRIRDRESKLMKKIKEALNSIKDGTYGICRMCGDDISISRLKARPVATHCIECKKKLEALELASGF